MRLAAMLKQSELQHAFSTPGERKIATTYDGIESVLGDSTVALMDALKLQMHEHVVQAMCKLSGNSVLPQLDEAGCIVSWLSPSAPPAPSRGVESSAYHYSDWHCDKANNFEYDITALLYLSQQDVDFGGGSLVFADATSASSIVHPLPGRLVVFDAGLESIHRVQPVEWGDRLLLSVWYGRREMR